MDDWDIEYEACNREFKEQHARKVAKCTIAQRMSGAAVMTNKLRI